MTHIRTTFLIVIAGLFLASCAMSPTLPERSTVIVPEPRDDAGGEFLSPFTSDEIVAPWVSKGLQARVGAEVGSLVGQKALENVPFVGGILGDRAGRSLGRAAAIEMVGGMDYMRSTTDLSFDSVSDLIVYTWANYEDHPSYDEVVKLVGQIYPEYSDAYYTALYQAPTFGSD